MEKGAFNQTALIGGRLQGVGFRKRAAPLPADEGRRVPRTPASKRIGPPGDAGGPFCARGLPGRLSGRCAGARPRSWRIAAG